MNAEGLPSYWPPPAAEGAQNAGGEHEAEVRACQEELLARDVATKKSKKANKMPVEQRKAMVDRLVCYSFGERRRRAAARGARRPPQSQPPPHYPTNTHAHTLPKQ